MSHTKGPWTVDVENGIPGIFADDGVVVCYTGEVAGIGKHFQRDNCEADARLIAAAPDLLEALSHLVDVMTVELSGNRRSDAHTRIAKARAAIAKAKGES